MELSKVRTAEEIIARFKDGQIIAIGGQTNQYMPDRLIDCVLESGARHLTIYSIDSSDPGHGVSLLVEAGRVDAMITTHVGTNPLTNAKIQSGALKAEFNPMGTFIERIRCGGAGLGGVLTKTGLGTVVEEGKQIIEVNGESYLLETALRADIALTRCRRADPLGNLAYSGSSGHASHPVIDTCGALSIVECDHFCDLGELGPDEIKVPGMFVDMILAYEAGQWTTETLSPSGRPPISGPATWSTWASASQASAAATPWTAYSSRARTASSASAPRCRRD